MVWALGAITFLSFVVWLHHFFTMGAGPNVNAFFGFMTMIIAIPTGVKVFNWLLRCTREGSILRRRCFGSSAFVIIFTIGGMDGVLMSVAPVDFQVHNSLFLIAHFHSMVIGGVLFGFFAGFTYWFPKIYGFKFNEKLGEYAFYCWIFGFLGAFVPLYILGLMGATRRLDHYDASTGWWPLFAVAACGVVLILCGIALQIAQLVVSVKHRKKNRDITGDPWNGRTLEWSTSSPPPFYNFAIIPRVQERDAFWDMKQHKKEMHTAKKYEDIHMPKNSALGVVIGAISFSLGFAIVWHILWLSIASLLGIIVCIIIRLMDEHTEFVVTAAKMKWIEADIARKHHL